MDPIKNREDLIQRMTTLFSSVGVPGLSGRIRDLSYEAGTVTIDLRVDASLAKSTWARVRRNRCNDASLPSNR